MVRDSGLAPAQCLFIYSCSGLSAVLVYTSRTLLLIKKPSGFPNAAYIVRRRVRGGVDAGEPREASAEAKVQAAAEIYYDKQNTKTCQSKVREMVLVLAAMKAHRKLGIEFWSCPITLRW
ncbi:unnamed protein product [Gongylonema pulchrum]|uniref:Tetratricopeptide repeat (TPR)-like superfamily protein n=1 Tax=Gongylonema pulchrum TaxID=637853 RepID=A0A183DXY7_9BILA|nr:unnamed protein product [Gongylonema pulchrum]